jgi:hypothetical protein
MALARNRLRRIFGVTRIGRFLLDGSWASLARPSVTS